jgi:hypothetical protein
VDGHLFLASFTKGLRYLINSQILQ